MLKLQSASREELLALLVAQQELLARQQAEITTLTTLNFAYTGAMEALETQLREAGVTIVRSVSDEGFGYQLKVADVDGMLIKNNQIDPELYQ